MSVLCLNHPKGVCKKLKVRHVTRQGVSAMGFECTSSVSERCNKTGIPYTCSGFDPKPWEEIVNELKTESEVVVK